MQIPFCGSTYSGRSVNIDASRSINLYPEIYKSEGGKSQIIMTGTPGLKIFVLGIGGLSVPIRGVTTFNGLMYVVAGNKLYSVQSDGTTSAALGTLSTSTGRVSFQNNGTLANGIGGDQLMIIDGTNGYLYNQVTTVFSTISGGGWPGSPKQIEYLDGYFIMINGSMSHWVSDLYTGGTWRALATSPVSAVSDNIMSVIVHRQQVFFIKERSTEVWYNAGIATTVGSPLLRVTGAVYDYGTVAQYSPAKGGSAFYFLCTQRTKDGGEIMGVAMITEYTPVIISTPAIDYKIAKSSTNVNCFGYCYMDQGHIFYVLTNPDANWTLVYDSTTEMWHERSSLMTSCDTVNRHIGNCYTFFNNKHYVGDYRNSNIYEMTSSQQTDNGIPIWSIRTAQTITDMTTMSDLFISLLVIDMETGDTATVESLIDALYKADGSIMADGSLTAGELIVSGGATGEVYLSWSNDSGHTWSAEYPCSLGEANDFSRRIIWRRLGRARNRVFRIRMSGTTIKNIINSFVEVSK